MAKELFWKKDSTTVAGGTTELDGQVVIRNQGDDVMHIRRIFRNVRMTTATVAEFVQSQISKAPALQGDESTFFNHELTVEMPANAATPGDTGNAEYADIPFARGQLVLRPKQALYLNVAKSTGPSSSHSTIVGFEY